MLLEGFLPFLLAACEVNSVWIILAYLYDKELCVAKQRLAVCKHTEVAFGTLHIHVYSVS